jgi:peptide-methionine (S)-S-oxide reductase
MKKEKAILAGGCFWGIEDLIRKLPGVLDTEVGYIGGNLKNPTYQDVKSGNTNHAEAIEIIFDSEILSYEKLLEFFFQIHDPSTLNRQGNDIGTSYRSAIFYLNESQKNSATKIIEQINTSKKWPGKVATEIMAANEFYPAEAYHQDYLENYPNGYTCHFIRPNWKIN